MSNPYLSIRALSLSLLATLLIAPGAVAEAGRHDQYVGDERCKTCHSSIYDDYRKTGHPYKLQKIDGGPPRFPTDTSAGVPDAPPGLSWADISYVIGGFAWKARFMDRQGYILTGAEHRQYNLANALLDSPAGWSGYDAGQAPRKPYTCGACHTTGWVGGDAGGPHQDDLPGIYGTWAATGVTCEACHGPAGQHVANPSGVKPPKQERCGDCHSRGEVERIDAADGLIRHHEQYEDLLASPHRRLPCTTCHDPHKSVKYGGGGFKGVQQTCMRCHADQEVRISAKAKFECVTCHLPRVAKSAVAVKHPTGAGDIPEGDVRSHIFRITTDPDWSMFSDDGSYVRLDQAGKAYLTLEYTCLICHKDRDKAWALDNSGAIHAGQ
jgi:hypothetical protein